MILYNENKKMFLPFTLLKIGEGSTGSVYRFSNQRCIKIYNEALNKKFITEIKKIRKLKLNKFYEIYDILYNSKGEFKGYTMKYYKSTDLNMLTMPTDYLLENLYDLLKSFAVLSSNGLKSRDLNRNNVIVNNSGIYVIDIDDYVAEEDVSRSILFEENTEEVIKLFEDLMAFSIVKYFEKPSLLKRKYIEENRVLFSLDNPLNADNIPKKLVKYKYPIDYFRSKVK